MDPCSLKDAVIGQGPVKNVRDLWTRLATSARGTTGIASLLSTESSSLHPVAEEQPVYIYLLPWRETMNTSLEYRVICAPGGLGKSVRFRNTAGINHSTTPLNPTKSKYKSFKKFGEVYKTFTPRLWRIVQ